MIKKQITQKAYLRECTDFARLATEAFKETPDYPKRKINKPIKIYFIIKLQYQPYL